MSTWARQHHEATGHTTLSALGGIDTCKTCGAMAPLADLAVERCVVCSTVLGREDYFEDGLTRPHVIENSDEPTEERIGPLCLADFRAKAGLRPPRDWRKILTEYRLPQFPRPDDDPQFREHVHQRYLLDPVFKAKVYAISRMMVSSNHPWTQQREMRGNHRLIEDVIAYALHASEWIALYAEVDSTGPLRDRLLSEQMVRMPDLPTAGFLENLPGEQD